MIHRHGKVFPQSGKESLPFFFSFPPNSVKTEVKVVMFSDVTYSPPFLGKYIDMILLQRLDC